MQKFKLRRWLLIVLVLLSPLAAYSFMEWRRGTINGGQKYAKPFRIAGNFYYVGANDIASFLITGRDGHFLIDGGYPGTPRLIMASIAELGFDIKDVKVLLNSEPHYDHAGGLAELQQASGAELWSSEPSAGVIASGGDDPNNILPIRFLVWTRIIRYPPARVDHRFKDGDTVRLGPIALTAHLTPGHTRGCTSWSFPVQDGDRMLNVVSACSLVVVGGLKYSGYDADFTRTFQKLRSLPADVWVTSHARQWGRYRKFLARDTATTPAAPFIDREGYRTYIDNGEEEFRRGIVH